MTAVFAAAPTTFRLLVESTFLLCIHYRRRDSLISIKKNTFFFGFRSINGIRDFEDSTDFYDLLARADDLDYKWLDVVFLIDKHIYPAGLIDVRVRDVFLTLATRKIGPHSSGFAINGIVPDRAKANEYILRTNQGDLFEDQKTKKLYLQVDPRKSSITQGSSGTLVLTQSKDDFYSPPQPGFDYSESIPIGILKCRVEQSVVKKDFIRFEVQTFEFLTDINLWITEFKTAPPTIFERNCVQINGRGHGGL